MNRQTINLSIGIVGLLITLTVAVVAWERDAGFPFGCFNPANSPANDCQNVR